MLGNSHRLAHVHMNKCVLLLTITQQSAKAFKVTAANPTIFSYLLLCASGRTNRRTWAVCMCYSSQCESILKRLLAAQQARECYTELCWTNGASMHYNANCAVRQGEVRILLPVIHLHEHMLRPYERMDSWIQRNVFEMLPGSQKHTMDNVQPG